MKSFKQFITEVHFSDMFGDRFLDFRKKYSKVLKSSDRWGYYVNFTNFNNRDALEKIPFDNPTHKDPVGTYAYPLEYVIKYPADVNYASDAKFLRVLKMKETLSSKKVLRLTYVTSNELDRYIRKLYPNGTLGSLRGAKDIGGISEEDLLTKAMAEHYGFKKVSDFKAKHKPSPGKLLFFAIQTNLTAEPEHITGKMFSADHREWPLFDNTEQTKRIKSLGFNVVVDESEKTKAGIINEAEPRQIIFLDRTSFDVVEIVPLYAKEDKHFYSGNVGAVFDMSSPRVERKLVAQLAEILDDKIKKGPESTSLGGWSYYWTTKGNRIEVYLDNNVDYNRYPAGERKHKQFKLHNQHQIDVKIQTPEGEMSGSYDESAKFNDILNDIRHDWIALKGNPKETDYKPQDKKAFLKAMEKRRQISIYDHADTWDMLASIKQYLEKKYGKEWYDKKETDETVNKYYSVWEEMTDYMDKTLGDNQYGAYKKLNDYLWDNFKDDQFIQVANNGMKIVKAFLKTYKPE